MTATCLYCSEPLTFTPDKGWHHQDGELYKQRVDGARCPRGHRFYSLPHAQPFEFAGADCPTCGLPLEVALRDDHCATPGRS